MKSILVTFLVSMSLVPLLPCKGSDPVTSEGKDFHPPRQIRQSTNSVRRQVHVRNDHRSQLGADWRISYYTHVSATPWWPTAPGD